jgi:hypothetical protein
MSCFETATSILSRFWSTKASLSCFFILTFTKCRYVSFLKREYKIVLFNEIFLKRCYFVKFLCLLCYFFKKKKTILTDDDVYYFNHHCLAMYTRKPLHLLIYNVRTKVVKIAIQLVKSYVFTSQYRLYVLNRSQNLEMGKIGSKSGKIVKIGWNRLKSRFHCRFNEFARRR